MKIRTFENRTIASVTIGFFFIFLGFDGAQQYIVPLFEQNANGSTALRALILLYAVFFIANLFGPHWVARLGARSALILGSTAYPLIPLAVALNSKWLLFIAAFLTGLGATLLWNASGQIVSYYSSTARFASNQGLKYSALIIGSFIGSLGGGALLTSISPQHLYWGYFFFSIVGTASFLFVASMPATKPIKQNLLAGLVQREILLVAPFVMAGYFMMFLSIGALKVDLLNRFGLAAVGVAGIVLRFAATLGALSAGHYSDRIRSPLNLAYVILAMGIVGLLLFQFGTNLTIVLPACLLMALSFAAVYPVITALIKKHCSQSQEDFNRSLGAFHVYGTGGMLLGLIFSECFSPTTCIVIAILALSASLPGIALLDRASVSEKK